MPRDSSSPAPKPKRTSACLHCRRQKLKCDGAPDKPCSRCRDDNVECIVRPRANAAILTDDLRWQQTVEARLQSLSSEIEAVKAQNAELQRQLLDTSLHADTSTPRAVPSPPSPPSTMPTATPAPLPAHLGTLRDILQPALAELERPTPLDVSIDDAAVLWEYFYDSMAIFHGFTASTELATPSPLLFTAVVTASAKRLTGRRMRTPVERWEELFQRALVRLLYVTVPKTWDDVVGLGIARTWFWKADEITSGLVYGAFVETSTPDRGDFRDRRVWDFIEMTTVSHGILHLSVPIVPETPPPGVPARGASHVLLSALNELFDNLGHLNRAITSARSLVMTALMGQGGTQLSYAEVMVLRRCRDDLETWRPKWLYEIQNADAAKLPTGSEREFLLDLVLLYYRVASVVVDGYLHQAAQPDAAQYMTSCRELLDLVVGRWSTSLHLWPKLFLHSALVAALALPTDDALVRPAHDLFVALAPMLLTSGSKLLHRLMERMQQEHGVAPPVESTFTPIPDLDLPAVMAYTGSDSFWADLNGVLGLPQTDVLSTPLHVEGQWAQVWGMRQ
ncbi:hypothetical protein CC85DRAFT_329561 [Cutaneotrichosporon oleaginosum]|uniref:Zn(2)-C6 fungal-type domain-containing protein n=1 Tax=Cutaneotrichosporon oleaginosum TaxID=879819 RepID=A0A0J1AZM1_9TREE|nr:uncharacterized protein CC85DRAFT_329561 [Cutaneotrichosporon oleaginosum]KLT40784.1 hypothetical protein CC85DRAFT_329561 [Cutaneotrichosporon oleaginosum]TXT11904.1 hypothetical protein COLE_02314 [Cutaneotrichosporon oleaginosum]